MNHHHLADMCFEQVVHVCHHVSSSAGTVVVVLVLAVLVSGFLGWHKRKGR